MGGKGGEMERPAQLRNILNRQHHLMKVWSLQSFIPHWAAGRGDGIEESAYRLPVDGWERERLGTQVFAAAASRKPAKWEKIAAIGGSSSQKLSANNF